MSNTCESPNVISANRIAKKSDLFGSERVVDKYHDRKKKYIKPNHTNNWDEITTQNATGCSSFLYHAAGGSHDSFFLNSMSIKTANGIQMIVKGIMNLAVIDKLRRHR